MSRLPLTLIAGLAGPSLALVIVLNALLGSRLGHVIWATAVTFSTGTLILIILAALLTRRAPDLQAALRQPFWIWGGGVVGAIYAAAAVVAVTPLGVALMTATAVTGQLLFSLTMDHFGWLVPRRRLRWQRVLGAALLLLGVVLVLEG